MLEHILRDRDFSLRDEIEDVITQAWNNLTFDDVQSVFTDWIRRVAWLAEDYGEYMSE
jgi:predicted metal-dependent enzyme (double-stranded beta helix superfamily)